MRKTLTLEVIGEPPLDETGRIVLYEDGGIIGREPGARGLRLPASLKQISRHHARITCDGRTFFLENLGQIGTTLNDESLEDERKYPLEDGDQIGIDVLKIAVSVSEGSSPEPVGPHRKQTNGDDWCPKPNQARKVELRPKPPTPAPPDVDYGRRPVIVPAPAVDSEDLPEDWINHAPVSPKTEPDPPPPAPSRPTTRSRKAPAGTTIDLEDVFRGAGLDPALATPQLAQQFGELLRVAVQGTMDLLQSRQSIKLDIQAGHTVFNPRGLNNPLKFSRSADDALHLMLGEQERGYLGPVPALNEAFEDLRHHEYAMLDGVRQAFEELLDRFNPARLQEEFDAQAPGNALPLMGKPKYWDLYTARFHDMFSDADAAYRRFRETFGRAYERAQSQLRVKDGSRPS
jgi:type VI secretion system FHA domain protein